MSNLFYTYLINIWLTVALKLFLLVVINIEYIITSFGTLCFMHIVSERN